MDFRELLEVNSAATLNFFYGGLRNNAASDRVTNDQTIYVASILASYAQTSVYDSTSLPPMANLSEVLDNFVLNGEVLTDPEILEIAGAQSLFLTGFFREQMKRRHNVGWFEELGGSFYERASFFSKAEKRRMLFRSMSENFPLWTQACAELHKTLRENRFLLDL
ncbi:MAG: hypothetical protein WD690_02010 [Vicinamibacterales bacterium]